MQLPCGATSDISHYTTLFRSDNCSAVTITYSDAPSTAGCAGAGINRTWTATDACLNHSSCVQHIAFTDSIAPVSTCAADMSFQCGAPSDTSHTGRATATDNCL